MNGELADIRPGKQSWIRWHFSYRYNYCAIRKWAKKYGDYFCWQLPLFANNSPSILQTMSLPNLSLPDRTSKVLLTNTSTEKLKENKFKFYKNEK